MPFHRLKLAIAAGALALASAACASAPEPAGEDVTIYVDPDTGQYSTDPGASAETKSIVDTMNRLLPPTKQAAALTEAEIWKSDSADNRTHIQSGLMCPVSWSGMPRNTINIFKQTGQDVGCSYTANGAIISYYAYRNSGTPAEEVQQVMDTVVTSRHPIYQPAEIKAFELLAPRGALAHDEISFQDTQGTEHISGVAICEIAGWRLKLRYTYPAADRERIEAFMGASLLGQQDSLLSAAKESITQNQPGSDDTI